MAVTDLTNTKWLINDDGLDIGNSITYNIDFVSNNGLYASLIFSDPSRIYYDDIRVVNIGIWVDQAYRTIEITGGTDVTNANLISWLTANATQITSGGSMYIGTSTISKMYIGQDEVEKIYFGQDLVYEKQASGFSVSGTNDTSGNQTAYYSTDNGSTWNAIPTGSFTLPAMTTFKLKIGGYADYLMSASSTQLGLNLPLRETSVQTSSNYTLTQNITDLTIHGEWD